MKSMNQGGDRVKVWLMLGLHAYAESEIVGVFSTAEAAAEEKSRRNVDPQMWEPQWEVYELTVDNPDPRCHVPK